MNTIRLVKLMGLLAVMSIASGQLHAGGKHKAQPTGSDVAMAAISAEDAQAAAKDITGLLVKEGKLEKSWLRAKHGTATKKKFKNGTEWVVSFKNNKVKKAQQTLYIFLSLNGDYLGANHTGK